MTFRDKCVDALSRKFKPTVPSAAKEAQKQIVDIILNEVANADDETILAITKTQDLFDRENPAATDEETMRAALKAVFGKAE